mmetsp:Transcript_31979/g.70267  ORF Transcript_31979/g.70267 Transcript_31979/m.70267 type:complete len:238 (+) Transcript_31979:792-1505(+)
MPSDRRRWRHSPSSRDVGGRRRPRHSRCGRGRGGRKSRPKSGGGGSGRGSEGRRSSAPFLRRRPLLLPLPRLRLPVVPSIIISNSNNKRNTPGVVTAAAVLSISSSSSSSKLRPEEDVKHRQQHQPGRQLTAILPEEEEVVGMHDLPRPPLPPVAVRPHPWARQLGRTKPRLRMRTTTTTQQPRRPCSPTLWTPTKPSSCGRMRASSSSRTVALPSWSGSTSSSNRSSKREPRTWPD